MRSNHSLTRPGENGGMDISGWLKPKPAGATHTPPTLPQSYMVSSASGGDPPPPDQVKQPGGRYRAWGCNLSPGQAGSWL